MGVHVVNIRNQIAWWILLGCGTLTFSNAQAPEIDVPRVWDGAALADWTVPLAGLNLRPTHISEAQYYSLRVENLRTYPVYFPGREPQGYWEMLQHVGPKPLIEPEKLRTEAEWLEAGERVFDELDHLHMRTLDQKFIEMARNRETYSASNVQPLPDGTVPGVRWVPTNRGVMLGFPNCANCHRTIRQDGIRIPGAPAFAGAPAGPVPLVLGVQFANHILPTASPFRMSDEPFGMWLFQASSVPWLSDGTNERLKTVTATEFRALIAAGARGGSLPRWNGSPYYPAKIPDLIGVKDRKYFDATATHLHRGIGDLMRYSAQVSFAETADFGPHHMLSTGTSRVEARVPDAALFALAKYIYSLKPPRNPNPFNAEARAGQKIFEREGCTGCHTPPLFTNNKVTLAKGFARPDQATPGLEIVSVSVGTDPGLSLRTRKGTGYYKVPSLRGAWYRGHFLHDGSVASLEEMFDPDRLQATHVPGGWFPPGSKTRAIMGHEFGLKLPPEERDQLIAYLKTL
jgi:hypothetical protein